MEIIAVLITFPFAAALLFLLLQKVPKVRSIAVYAGCILVLAAVLYYAITGYITGTTETFFPETLTADRIILGVEVFLMVFIVAISIRYRKYYVGLLSLAQTGLMVWLELFSGKEAAPSPHILSDKLTIMMALIIGVVGTLICVYAVGYMKEYHHHHKEYKDRSALFFALLFVFLGAMFGLVFSNNLTWMYFFWEITSLCSFLLIGYTRTEEATNNAFRALWMNLLGGLGFAIAIVYSVVQLGIGDLKGLVSLGSDNEAVLIPLVFLSLAALTKSAQLPFSRWLLGAMVAPTPTSALLHSATMVKAGVFLLIRLSPLFHGNLAGTMVTMVGGFTFLATSILAISQSDAKKVLAYSTISNLGLIVACAGVGMHEAVWAGVFLMLFHAISKSLMFLSVGAVENSLGSRNIEDMHGLIVKLPGLAFVMITGIAGMFLAPFGMLISKWAALKAFVDTNSMILVIFLVFGSATTLFYWTKWLGKLLAVIHNSSRRKSAVGVGQWISLFVQVFLMISLCLLFPVVSTYAVEPFLGELFHDHIPAVISENNVKIMLIMLFAIMILPVAVRLLTFGKKQKVVMSYMSGANTGDDRNFVDSFGENRQMYLANWYLPEWFGEDKILLPSILIGAGLILTLMGVILGGAL